jgi:Omp85 superfamily domain
VLDDERYSFRQTPYRQRHEIGGDFATTAKGFQGFYDGEFHWEGHRAFLRLDARASQLDILHFYGYGNETPSGDRRLHEVQEDRLRFEPTLVVPLTASFEMALAPRLIVANATGRDGAFVSQVRPYGFGRFDRASFGGSLRYDTRDVPKFAGKGVLLTAGASVTPSVLDSATTFGDVQGDAAVHWSLFGKKACILSLRAGGRKVFGQFPFTEAASLGGADTLRGYRSQRFAGDAATWGNAELRVRLGNVYVLLPWESGIFAISDAGRVYLDGESSNKWHTDVGGGIWFALLNRANTVTIGAAHSNEGTRFFAGAGFGF